MDEKEKLQSHIDFFYGFLVGITSMPPTKENLDMLKKEYEKIFYNKTS